MFIYTLGDIATVVVIAVFVLAVVAAIVCEQIERLAKWVRRGRK